MYNKYTSIAWSMYNTNSVNSQQTKNNLQIKENKGKLIKANKNVKHI
jgi:hypothetical protein